MGRLHFYVMAWTAAGYGLMASSMPLAADR